ncbi:MAG: phosphatidylserine decarboxylase [Candidatus Thermoplasmatota archaeon]
MNIAKGGWSWLLSAYGAMWISVGSALLLGSGFLHDVLMLVSLFFIMLCFFFIVFFRDPKRMISDGVVAVADGVIRELTVEYDEDAGECYKVSTFLNLYNVHVTRIPFEGSITMIKHIEGSHIPAFRKDSYRNERVIIKLDTVIGCIKIIMIAGTIARRIIPYIKEGDRVKKGDKIGLIRLGSRVDIYLPSKMVRELKVKKGSKVKAGVDSIADVVS